MLEGVEKNHKGIEIAPWFNPLAPKRDGYDIKIIDIFDTETLLERAKADPAIAETGYERLEDVDYVGSAVEIAELVPEDLHGSIDYVISSHNFEHLPNPVRFLQGVEKILRPGGHLTMALPDARGCFDFFRPSTTTGQWLQAHFENRKRPTYQQLFEMNSGHASRVTKDGELTTSDIRDAELSSLALTGNIEVAFRRWNEWREASDETYRDTHCTVMTPASFQLNMLDIRAVELIGLEVEWVTSERGMEFLARVRKPLEVRRMPRDEIKRKRNDLARAALRERSDQAKPKSAKSLRKKISSLRRTLFRKT